jgi:hypothetical protein
MSDDALLEMLHKTCGETTLSYFKKKKYLSGKTRNALLLYHPKMLEQ